MKYLLLVIVLVFLFVIRNKKIKLVEPGILYTVIWTSIIVLYSFNTIGIFPTLSIQFYIVFLLSYLLFMSGNSLGKKIKVTTQTYEYSNKRLYSALKFIFVMVGASFFLTIIKLGLPPILSGLDREHYYVGYLEIFYLTIYAFWFIGFYLISKKFKVKRILVLILISLCIVILKGNKFPAIYFICLSLYYREKNKSMKVKNILAYISIIIVIFAGAVSLYVSDFDNYISYKTGLVKYSLSAKLWFLIDPIIYLSSNFMNLSNYLKIESVHSFGLNCFNGILSLTKINELFLNKYLEVELAWSNSLMYPWLTTGTYLKTVFVDFGLLGIIVIPFLYGLLSAKYYKIVEMTSYNCSIINIFLSFSLFYSICISFFSFYFRNMEIITNFILIIGIHKFAVIKNENLNKIG